LEEALNSRFTIDSAIFLAGLTAILYTWSTALYHGFLKALHLDPDMMERNFHQVLYSGLVLSVGPICAMLIFIASFLYVYAHLVLPTFVVWLRRSIALKRNVVKVRRFLFGKRNISRIESRANALFARAILVTFFGFLYLISLVHFEQKGVVKAEKLLQLHHDGKSEPGRFIRADVGTEKKQLLFLGCGAHHCAGIENVTDEIHYFASSSGYSYMYKDEK
jgi:hypothetical protein